MTLRPVRRSASPCSPRLLALVVLAAAVLPAASGCSQRSAAPAREPAVLLPLQIFADTGRSVPFAVLPPTEARAWLQRVSRTPPPARPAPATPARPAPLDLPPPEASPALPEASREPTDALIVDDGLRPPIPIGAALLMLPKDRRALAIDLDVRVDEAGEVSDAIWAGGSEDSAAVAAVTACALAMRFHPALQRGRPIAVWCRQRFEFGRAGVRAVPNAATEP